MFLNFKLGALPNFEFMLRGHLFIILSMFLFFNNGICQSGVPLAGWKEYLPYGSAIKVAAGDNSIFCATPYSIYNFDPTTGAITRFSKINGLAETGISSIAFDSGSKNLIIGYTNSNIDLLSANNITNITDLKRANYTGDKNIYNIYCRNSYAYLSTGLGIILIDERRHETKETYVIGSTGSNIKVTGVTTDQLFIYAATSEGLKKASLQVDLTDYHNWQLISTGLTNDVVNFQNRILFLKHDSLFVTTGTTSSFFYGDGYPITNINVSSEKLLISENKPGMPGRIVDLGINGVPGIILESANNLKIPQQAILKNNNYYAADLYGGLESISGNTVEKIVPNAPFERSSGEIKIYDKTVYVAAGAVSGAWNYTYSPFGLYKLENNFWSFYNQYNYPILNSVYDILTIARDRRNKDIYYGSFGGGLIRLSQNNTLKIYKQSVVSAAVGDPGSYRVSGLAFDAADNLWISNYGAANGIVVKKADSSIQSFAPPFTLADNAVAQILVDDADQKWIVSPKGNGLLCFNTGKSIENTADDKWKLFRSGAGNGNLPDNQVFCVAKDKNGLIWVGTAKGIALIPCPNEIFSSGCEALLPVVRQGQFAGYLLQNDQVQTIAIDGANRKWVGTHNGLWLLSESGETVIDHYTEDNSPLLSNDIKYIAVDPHTGEVFVETFKGLCSIRGTATQGGESNNNVLVFPNPVPPGFAGLIAIRGLVDNAIVKITQMDGRLVYETRALGGQAVWNGKNYKGQKVSSGAYLILVTNDTNQQKIAGKIFIVK